ncbi:hypothetical protein Zmor_011604 [Zophobas morio]|uniref:C2H2-type domain-containing protein n=1 Tax=Zophobas morio TaxID=2755281 RepID=A0AA38IME8_9CUCU|nr:hypothetical protein Zmor_011604 [Zophobas morio]
MTIIIAKMVHSCDRCGLYFPLAKTLQTHQKLLCKGHKPSTSGKDGGDSVSQPSEDVASANLECPYCSRVLQTKSGLTRYLRDSCANRKKDTSDETSI